MLQVSLIPIKLIFSLDTSRIRVQRKSGKFDHREAGAEESYVKPGQKAATVQWEVVHLSPLC